MKDNKVNFSDFKIQALTVYNFLSLQEIEINFNEVNTLLLTGNNGSGKSSILSAIVFNLYGTVFDRGAYTQSDLISNSNVYKKIDKNALKIYDLEKKVETLTIGRYTIKEKPLVIIRGLLKKGKAFLKVFYDNKKFNYKDYSVANSNLEKLLTISSKDFKANSYFHSDTYLNIISLTNKPKQLMDILNSIFNLDKLDVLHDYFNKKSRKIEQSYTNTISEYLVAKENAKYFQQHLNTVIDTLKQEIGGYASQIKTTEEGIVPIKNNLKEMEIKLNTIKKDIKENKKVKKDLESGNMKLQNEKYSINKSIEWVKNQLKTMKEGDTTECNMCHSIITKKQLEKNYTITNSKNEKILNESIVPKTKDISDKLKAIESIMQEETSDYDSLYSQYNKLKSKLYAMNNDLSYFKKEIEARKSKIKKQEEIKKDNEINIKYATLVKEVTRLFKENLKYSPMRNMFNYNSELKIQIFMYYLKLLNELMIKYAELLKQEYTPKFVIDKNNKIKLILMSISTYSDNMYLDTIDSENTIYENLLSQGEKKKQNIIIIFAFIEFMLFYNFNKKHLGILLLDELSVNLDDTSIRIFYDAISNMSNLYNLQIIVSCHELYPRDFETRNYIDKTFDSAYYITKDEEKGTTLKQITL